MKYEIAAHSQAKVHAEITIRDSAISFGVTGASANDLPSPAELFLSAFAACILKNVERFSGFMKFEYDRAEISVSATRLEKPPRMDALHYQLKIFSQDTHLNRELLMKNIAKFGTIYNTVKRSSQITGEIEVVEY